MPSRTPEERAASRAEARRRARLAARGEVAQDDSPDLEPDEPATRRSVFDRLFPPAPPLPNKPDPLAKFDRNAPLRPIRERIYLLRRNPLPWVLGSLACFIGYTLSGPYRASPLGLLGTFLAFGSLIAAGWFGWQRPALFGTVTALIAWALLTIVIVLTYTAQGFDLAAFPAELALPYLLEGVIRGGFGFLGGWYGGYLRRRQAQVSAEARRAPVRRRG
jgi:hypothetical protein